MGVEIRIERYDDVIGEIKPLLEMHYLEIASFKDDIPLDPDYARYQELETQGVMVILAARRDGLLVGYSILLLTPHIHYKSTLFAMSDIIFLLPSERSGGLGVRLIRESERVAIERGAKKISWHIKPVNDFSQLLIKHMGYVHDEINVAKILEV